MGKNLRDKAMMAMLGTAALYALAVIVWFASAADAWKKAAKNYAKAKETYRRECRLIGEKEMWAEAYEKEKAQMQTFEVGMATDTTWQRRIDKLANKNHIAISSQQPGKEVEAGDVLELPIEIRNWEGCLEALVRFMYDLENSSDGMFDITQLNFKPSSKQGYLRGSMTVNCAYMREK